MDVREALAAFVVGDIDEHALADVVAEATGGIVGEADHDLAAEIRLSLAELRHGDVSLEELRREFADLLQQQHATYPASSAVTRLDSGASNQFATSSVARSVVTSAR